MADNSFLIGLLEAAGDVAYNWDMENDQIEWFGAWNRLFRSSGPPLNSKDFYDVIYDDDRHFVFGVEAQTIDREYRLKLGEGRLVPVHENGVAEFKGDRLIRQYGLLRLIDQSASKFSSHQWQGRDELTGCIDRTRMLAQIQRALDSAKAIKRSCAYLVIGIDKMSFVNEAVGMEAGDGLLRGVAQRVTEILPARAHLARVGGDMFGILLTDPMSNDFPALAEKLLQNFRHHPVVTGSVPLHITVSIGAVRMPAVARTATEAMIFAEQALHDANQRGRNLFVEYAESPQRMQENRLMLEMGGRVKHALKHDGLRLAFQSIVDAQTGEPLFYEALVRMFDNDGRIIPAATFIPVVEQQGLANELDRHVLDLTLKELEDYPNLSLAMNISGLTAAQTEWPDHIRRMLGTRRDAARRLIIEITETAAIVDVSETRRFVDTLRELGGRVSLDDFGAGSTSIRHLRMLGLSIMKIDRDLLENILVNSEQQHIVRMLLEIARGLGLKTVAEGVETAAVANWLRSEKVDMMQGYFFGEPALERPWLKTAEGRLTKEALRPLLESTQVAQKTEQKDGVSYHS